MSWDDPHVWRWIWLVTAVVFAVGELSIPTSFFLVSFAAGAVLAAGAAFLGASLVIQWVVFLGGSGLALLVLKPLGRRVERSTEAVAAVGAHRWVGRTALVLREIPGAHETGLVRVEREEWRAESADGSTVPSGHTVRVVRVDGTRMIVVPLDTATAPPSPPTD